MHQQRHAAREAGAFRVATGRGDFPNQAIKDGVARVTMTRDKVRAIARHDIELSRRTSQMLMDKGLIEKPGQSILQEAFQWACDRTRP
jgi:malate dehydrogenase (oxaloacetate-decarboxylating)